MVAKDSALFSSKSDEWSTPQSTFDSLNERFHFTLDVAADKENAKCDRFYSILNNALDKD